MTHTPARRPPGRLLTGDVAGRAAPFPRGTVPESPHEAADASGVQEMMRCTDPIPLDPGTAELIAAERDVLADWNAEMSRLKSQGWVIVGANTMESPLTRTYRKFNMLRLPSPAPAPSTP